MPLPEDPSIEPDPQLRITPTPAPDMSDGPDFDGDDDVIDLEFWDEDDGDGDDEPVLPTPPNPDDFSLVSLKAKQLANYEAQLAKGKPTEIADRSEPVQGARTYDQLTQTFLPLILDDPRNATGAPQKPWTLAEIIHAMEPIIGRAAQNYGTDNRASYQPDDAKSDGYRAVMIALQKDGGRSPFGYYASKSVHRALQAGTKGAGAIPVPLRNQTYTDRRISSLDKPIGGTEKTGSGIVPTSTGVAGRGQPCPACNGKKKVVDPVTGQTHPCGVCDERGFVVVSEPRSGSTPDIEASETELSGKQQRALRHYMPAAGLSERQLEVMLLRFGAEGLFNPGITNTGEPKEGTAVGRIIGAADMINRKPPANLVGKESQRIEPSGYWVEAERQGKTDLFQQIWDKTFGDKDDPRGIVPHKPFNPDAPAALQIAVLYQMTEDRPETEKSSSVWPPPKVPQQKLGRLYGLMVDLHKAFGGDEADLGRPAWAQGPPMGIWTPKSKTAVQNQMLAAKAKIDKYVASGKIPPGFTPEKIIPGATARAEYGDRYQSPQEAVNIVLDCFFKLMLEDIARGDIVTMEDIDRYDQAITT